MDLGNNIKIFRKKGGFKQCQFARLIGVSKACLCLYESGKRVPSIDMLIKIANVLQVSLDELVGRIFKT